MARETERLNAAKVASLAKSPEWEGPPRRRMYADGNGLYFLVDRKSGRSWILRYRLGGAQHAYGLGPYPLVSLADARQRATTARRQVRLEGVDPIATRANERATTALATKTRTFAETAAEYINAHRAKWSVKHASGYESLIERHAVALNPLPVAAIDRASVIATLEPIWHAKTESASRLQRLVKAVLDFAAVRGYRPEGLPNPADWAALKHVLPAPGDISVKRGHTALDYREIGEAMAKVRELPGTPARALEFMTLTAARTGEVRGMTWGELDIGAKVWTIPAARMKAGKEHRVPLSDRALELLRGMARHSGAVYDPITVAVTPDALVFNIGMNAMLDVAKGLGTDKAGRAITAHGFRSTFSTWAHESTGYAPEVVEAALAHVTGSAVARAYNRGDALDKRGRLMADWATYCGRPGETGGAKVVPIRA